MRIEYNIRSLIIIIEIDVFSQKLIVSFRTTPLEVLTHSKCLFWRGKAAQHPVKKNILQ